MKNLKKGVFSELLGRDGQSNAMQGFIQAAKFIGEAQPYVKALEDQYASIQNELERAAALEEIILLHQFMTNQPDPKFSLVEKYIYARVSVYRRDVALNDMRVVVEAVGPNDIYEDLIQQDSVIARAKHLLVGKVKKRLDEKLANYHVNFGPLTMQVA